MLYCIKSFLFLLDFFPETVVKDQTSVGNLATVAVLPISKDIQITSFTFELQHALQAIGKSRDHFDFTGLFEIMFAIQPSFIFSENLKCVV